ncbi:MAG: uracil-DNA glycosylase family protein [Legionellales bacterium]
MNLLDTCHPEWTEIINRALAAVDKDYLNWVLTDVHCLPGRERMLAAFSLPLSKTRYILVGESPYPRSASANGYAFWDNAVGSLWSEQGLSKPVNKATSLRNWIKALLVARGDLHADLSQQAIARVDKRPLVQTADALFRGMMQQGILLLNASLVYSEGKVPYHARHWRPFMQSLFDQLALVKPDLQLILFGKIAETIPQNKLSIGLVAQHPYNISFISNQTVLDFFNPLDLLADDAY